MITSEKWFRMILLIVAALAILLFSNLVAITIILITTGTILVMLGITIFYRPPSAIGLLLVATGAAMSVQLESLTEIRMFIVAVIGLFIPIFVISWVALSPKIEGISQQFLIRKPVLITVLYASICLVSVPAVVFLVSLFLPTISMRLSIMTEIAIILLVAIGGAVILTFRNSRPTNIERMAE